MKDEYFETLNDETSPDDLPSDNFYPKNSNIISI